MPVYNSALFIDKALESFKNQTMKKAEFEVIFVDDCSTDNSIEIIESYKKINLKVISLNENSGGPGAPRNKAIEHAKGEYIFFVDSDDYISKNALTDMYEFAKENNSDVLLAKMQGVNGRGVPGSMFKKTEGKVDLYESRLAFALGPTKMFKTSFLKEYEIYFPENLKTAEDQLFTMKSYIKATVISVLTKESYYYATLREGEHMNSAYVNPEDFYAIMSGIMKIVLSANETDERKYKFAASFLNRHFNFSRTTNFTLKSRTNEVKKEWMQHLHNFILNSVPEEVDIYTNPDIKARIILARSNDYSSYESFEKEYKELIFPVEMIDAKIIASFQSLKDYPILKNLDVTYLNKLTHNLTNIEFLNDSLLFSCTVKHSVLSKHVNNQQTVQAVFIHRGNKEEKIYEPILIQPRKGKFTFEIPFTSLILSNDEFGTWDLFIDSKVESYALRGRVGNKRAQYNYQEETSFLGQTSNNHFRLTPYFTKPYDNFSIYTCKLSSFEKKMELKHDGTKSTLLFKYPNRHLILPQQSLMELESGNQKYYLQNIATVWTDMGTELHVDISSVRVNKLFGKFNFNEIKINGLPLNSTKGEEKE